MRSGGASSLRRSTALDSSDQLSNREGFRDVVIRSDLQSNDRVELSVARRQHDDRHLRVGADPPTHFEPVDPRQSDVEEYGSRIAITHTFETRFTVCCVRSAGNPSRSNAIRKQISYLFLVFNEQHDTSVGHQHLARVGRETRRFCVREP